MQISFLLQFSVVAFAGRGYAYQHPAVAYKDEPIRCLAGDHGGVIVGGDCLAEVIEQHQFGVAAGFEPVSGADVPAFP